MVDCKVAKKRYCPIYEDRQGSIASEWNEMKNSVSHAHMK